MATATKEEIADAVSAYLADNIDAHIEASYDEGSDSYKLEDANGLKVVLGPGTTCTNDDVKMAILEYITNARAAAKGCVASKKATSLDRQTNPLPIHQKLNGKGLAATSGQSPRSVQAIQAMQAGRDLTYKVGKQEAPTANLALMAATDAGICLEEVDRVHNEGFVSSTIRAKHPDGRQVDATVSLMKQDFINLLAWKAVQEQEVLNNDILDDSNPLDVALPNGFPKLRPDATISTRVKDGNNSVVIKRKAITEIYIKIMNQWIFQQRQCQTKAKRNAIVQLLTSSGRPMQVMEPEELADEVMEVELVGAS